MKNANHRSSDDETAEGGSTNTDCHQDSDVSFMKDSDEEIDTVEIEKEECIEYLKRSTATAVERMKAAKIPCWIETHRRMKWRLAVTIASLQDERWTKSKWNPGLSTKYQTNRPVGRPKKRWEDEINEFLKSEETEMTNGNEIKKQRHLEWKANMQKQQPQHLLTENTAEGSSTRSS